MVGSLKRWIIWYLPPIKGTRKLHWYKVEILNPLSLWLASRSCTHRVLESFQKYKSLGLHGNTSNITKTLCTQHQVAPSQITIHSYCMIYMLHVWFILIHIDLFNVTIHYMQFAKKPGCPWWFRILSLFETIYRKVIVPPKSAFQWKPASFFWLMTKKLGL